VHHRHVAERDESIANSEEQPPLQSRDMPGELRGSRNMVTQAPVPTAISHRKDFLVFVPGALDGALSCVAYPRHPRWSGESASRGHCSL